MRRFWALPLRQQLVVAILLLLVPVILAAIWSGIATFRERTTELGEQAGIVAATTAAYVNRDVTNFDTMADRLAHESAIRAIDPEGARVLFGRIVVGRPAILRLVIATPDVQDAASLTLTDEPLEGGPWWRDVLATGRRAVMPMQTTPSGRARYVVLGYPITDDSGATKAALGLFMNVATLEDAFAALPLPPDSIINVIDLDGTILARSHEPEKYVGQSLVATRGTSREPLPPRQARGVDGVNRMYGEAAVEVGPWIVSVGVPMSLAVDRAVSLWTRSFSILALGLFGWLAVALVLTRRLGTSVSHLDAAAQRIAAGDFSPIEQRPMLSREFVDLQTAFDAMLRRFNETRAALDAQMAEERRIRQELESLQGQVIRQERLAAVGQLVSGVAHEINNPLQAILGFAELLQMQADTPDSVKNDLKLIQKESARACGIIRNLALFARQTPGEAAPLRLGDVIGSVAELRQRRLESEDIQLQIEDRSQQYVNAVMTELQQVLLNFVVNAEQSILISKRLPGRITIRTYDRGHRVVLEVEDTGPGVPPEHEAKLFQPFFTTKPVGQGTGLGLSVSYGIIDSLRGQIGYKRSPAGGSIFYFELPAAGVE